MPPKRTAAAVSKMNQADSTVAASKAKAKGATNATKSSATKDAPKPAPKPTATKPTATKPTVKSKASASSSKKRKAEESEDEEPQTNGIVAKRVKKDIKPATTKIATEKTTTKRAGPYVEDQPEPSTAPKTKADPKAKAEPKSKASKVKVVLNTRPTQLLDLYLFGGGEAGELGFAGAKGTKEIKRPRINPSLGADKVGVVQFSVGGMHTAALTHDNKILTWGVNDQGALGRDTTWDGGMKDMKAAEDDSDDDSDSDSDGGEINPHESTPGEVDFSGFDPVPQFTQVEALDSATFALTDDGLVYGWGTFRNNEGVAGFNSKQNIQDKPALLPGLKNIVKLAAGANHVLALDKAGVVYTWGAGQQNQLGRRVLERHQQQALSPTKAGLKGKYTDVGAGAYHSFAIKSTGDVYGWGLNGFGQAGETIDAAGEPGVILPQEIPSLAPSAGNGKVIFVTGGSQHSMAITDSGVALTWGRLDSHQVGIDTSSIPASDIMNDEKDRPRALNKPTRVSKEYIVAGAVGSSHSIIISQDGKAYSFGFNEYGQCGVGHTDDVKVTEHIDNTAVRGKQLVAVGCGGQFSCLGSVAVQTNGVNGH